MIEIVVLSQPDCRFCELAEEILQRLGRDYPLAVRHIRLDSEHGQALAVRHGVLFAPGILLDGQLLSYGRPSERRLRRDLDRHSSRQVSQPPTPPRVPDADRAVNPARPAQPHMTTVTRPASRTPAAPAARSRRAMVATVTVALLGVLVAGCSGGKDAVATGGSFSFVSPGGKTVLFYDPPATRGVVSGLSGDSLLQPGHPISLTDFPGQVVVLNIWGSWCGPCRAEAPDLEQTYQASKATGVTFLGIDVRDDRDAAADFVRDRHPTYPSIFDPPGRALDALHGFPRNTVPATIVLDREHRVAAIFLTRIRVSQLLPVVQRIAAEPTNTPGTPAPSASDTSEAPTGGGRR